MTYRGCYNAEFLKLLCCILELVTSRMDVHSSAAQFVGACQADTQESELPVVGKCKTGFFQVRTIYIAVNMLTITEQISFNCNRQKQWTNNDMC